MESLFVLFLVFYCVGFCFAFLIASDKKENILNTMYFSFLSWFYIIFMSNCRTKMKKKRK